MKQIAIRLIPDAPGVLDCIVGDIKDGKFTPCPFYGLDKSLLDLIHVDDLLGTSAYIRTPDLTSFLRIALNLDSQLALFQSFIIISLSDHESKKEKSS